MGAGERKRNKKEKLKKDKPKERNRKKEKSFREKRVIVIKKDRKGLSIHPLNFLPFPHFPIHAHLTNL